MRIPYRPLVIGLATLAFSAFILARAQAGDRHYFAPVTDPVVKEECGSCHMAFAPSMLPAKSWQRMMVNLTSISATTPKPKTPPPQRKSPSISLPTPAMRVASALAANCSKALPRDPPHNASRLPKWVSKHRKVPDWEWRHKDVRTKANCVACHSAAEQGYYEE